MSCPVRGSVCVGHQCAPCEHQEHREHDRGDGLREGAGVPAAAPLPHGQAGGRGRQWSRRTRRRRTTQPGRTLGLRLREERQSRRPPQVTLLLHYPNTPYPPPPSYIQPTSRDRPKSAPYLRLKNTRRTSKCQSIGELGTLLWNFFRKKVSQCRKKLKGGTIWDFLKSILSKNIKKLKVGPFGEKRFEKMSHRAENTLLPR